MNWDSLICTNAVRSKELYYNILLFTFHCIYISLILLYRQNTETECKCYLNAANHLQIEPLSNLCWTGKNILTNKLKGFKVLFQIFYEDHILVIWFEKRSLSYIGCHCWIKVFIWTPNQKGSIKLCIDFSKYPIIIPPSG